jgi:ATPase subunit of ABC transporter with duplicated ATPase domains
VTHGIAAGDVAWLEQHVEWPRPDGSLLDNFLARSPEATAAHARDALAAFLCRGDAALRPVSSFSGGEALRGAMATLLHAARPPLLLLLDEPTNHLDLDGTEAVERALRAWDGAFVVVSHDEVFLSAIGVERRLSLGGGSSGARGLRGG